MVGRNSGKRLALKSLVVIVSTLLALLAGEVALRVLDYRPPLSDRNMYVANGSDILPYKLKPGYEGYYLGEWVKIDANGERVVAARPELRAATLPGQAEHSVLIIGDSLVFGHGLRNEDTIGSQLQNKLWERGLNYRVRNIGVSGYTSWNEYGALKDYLGRERPDAVIIMYVPNDVSFDNDQLGIGKGGYSVQAGGTFNRFTQFMYRHFYVSYLLSDGIKRAVAAASAGRPKNVDAQYMDDSAIDYSMSALVEAQRLCDSQNVKFSVGIYRDVWHYTDPEKSLAYERKIQSNLEKRGINSFVIKSHIANLNAREVQAHWHDPHPSAKAVGFIVDDTMRELEGEISAGQR